MQWAKQKQAGFTIVELLIVIVVIGILAAITIVAFNGVQGRAHDASVQSDLRNAKTQLQVVFSDTGRYPYPPTASIGLKPQRSAYAKDRNNYYYCVNSDGSRFALSGVSNTTNSFAITHDGSVQNIGVSTGGDSTCALIGSGSWTAGVTSSNTWNAWVN